MITILMIILCLFGSASYFYALFKLISTGTFDGLWLLIGLLSLFISIFILLFNLPKKIKNSKFILNLENKSSSLFSYISAVILFFFGLALTITYTIHEYKMLPFFIGIIIIITFLYATYMFFFDREKVVFQVLNKDAVDGTKLYCVDLVNDELGLIEYYTKDPSKLLREKSYSFYYNKYTNRVLKEVNEVIDIQ